MIDYIKLAKIARIAAVSTAFVFAVGSGGALASVSVGGSNDTTGPNSENENEWEIDADYDLDIDNDADLESEFELDINSGSNRISHNTEVDDILTGDIEGDISVENEANMADVEIGSADVGDVEVDVENDTTGPYSENENEVEISMDREIDIDNDADVENELELDANTGRNRIRSNTVVGDVETGGISLSADFSSMLNQGDIDLGGLGEMDIEANMSNHLTGPNSENENKLEIDADVDVDIDNDADIENEFEVDANTGHNYIGSNTCVGNVETGSINLNFSVVNSAN